MDAAELVLVRKTFQNALATTSPDIVGLLGELGWSELLHADPAVAVGELFETHGLLPATTGALDVIVADTLGRPPVDGTAVVHPTLTSWDRPPGVRHPAGGLCFDGLVLAGAERANRLLVPLAGDDGPLGTISVGIAEAGVHLQPIQGLDPTLRLVAVSGRLDSATVELAIAGCRWGTVAAAARRALAHELCGLAQAVLDTTASHVTQRHQFGRPIAAFQTVQHRLTEVFVALASARATLDASWATNDPLVIDAAKALAGRAGLLAARHCLQVTGAIGFTEEYGLAAQIRRVSMLDALYGTADQLRARLGAGLIANRSVPRLHPLP